MRVEFALHHAKREYAVQLGRYGITIDPEKRTIDWQREHWRLSPTYSSQQTKTEVLRMIDMAKNSIKRKIQERQTSFL